MKRPLARRINFGFNIHCGTWRRAVVPYSISRKTTGINNYRVYSNIVFTSRKCAGSKYRYDETRKDPIKSFRIRYVYLLEI